MSTTLKNIRVYEPGRDVSGEATAAVTSRRFVKISGDRVNGSLAIATATAAARIFGVAANDADTGELVRVARGGVVKVTAGGNINAFAEVEVGSSGKAVTKSSGVAVGFALTGASTDADAEIALYH